MTLPSLPEPVPHSAGTRRPRRTLPALACDAHMHIFDARFAPSPHWPRRPPEADVATYRRLQQRIGTQRTVVVTPSTYGVDNACTLDALDQLGESARGVAVADADVTRAELERLASHRVRGLRAMGRDHARVLGRLLREQRVEPDVILSSPLPRAVQTAELLAQALDYIDVVTSLRCLEPSAHPRVAANAVLAAGANVIVVSHEPAVSSLGAFLLGRPSFPQFRTAQCCAIEDGKPTFTARADLDTVQTLFVD